jgi:competence protein ComEC
MWLGMLAAAVGQVSGLPVAPLTGLAGLLAGYIDQVAAWTASPGWAQLDLGVGGLVALGAVYVALGAGLAVGLRSAQRRVGLRPPGGAVNADESSRRLRRRALTGAAALLLAVALLARLGGGGSSPPAPGELRVDVLDVGQGDAILLRPAGAPAVLVDTGPPGSDLLGELDDLGVDELGALVVTHTDLDHIGGAADVLARLKVDEVLFARIDRPTRAAATAAGAELERIAAGARLHAGQLGLDVLWPQPTELGLGPPAEPNALALVMLARWHGFRMLLTADAEAELAPVEPGAVDVLKVAHHGSDDAGLAALLSRSDPELAVISVGADNTYGHPTPATLATLSSAGVPVLRTDFEGTVEIVATRSGWSVVED